MRVFDSRASRAKPVRASECTQHPPTTLRCPGGRCGYSTREQVGRSPCEQANARSTRRDAPQQSSVVLTYAGTPITHHDAGPEHGRGPGPVAGHRHDRRRLRQTDRRGVQLLHPVRAGPRPPAQPRQAGGRRDRGRGRGGQGVQHHRGGRRHRHGPRWDALQPAQPRPHRRLGGVHGQRPLRRRAGVHLQLRQDHPRDAHRRHAAERAHRVRLGRTDGGGQDQAGRSDREARPDQSR